MLVVIAVVIALLSNVISIVMLLLGVMPVGVVLVHVRFLRDTTATRNVTTDATCTIITTTVVAAIVKGGRVRWSLPLITVIRITSSILVVTRLRVNIMS